MLPQLPAMRAQCLPSRDSDSPRSALSRCLPCLANQVVQPGDGTRYRLFTRGAFGRPVQKRSFMHHYRLNCGCWMWDVRPHPVRPSGAVGTQGDVHVRRLKALQVVILQRDELTGIFLRRGRRTVSIASTGSDAVAIPVRDLLEPVLDGSRNPSGS